ncbi:MAG: nitroreductase family protein [Armatimonadota bacterium]
MTIIDTFEAITGRRSIRQFREDPIPDDVLDQVIEAARRAPYGTRADERVIVVLAGEEKTRLVEFLEERLESVIRVMSEGPSRQTLSYARSLIPAIGRAPVIIGLFTAVGREGPELSVASAACAAQNLMVAAHATGLATCYTTGALYIADEIAHRIGVPGHRLVSLLPLGYPEQEPRERSEFPTVLWRGFEDREYEELTEPREAVVSDVERSRSGKGEVVLLVTDTPQIDERIARCLRRAGYEVCVCGPSEALDVFARRDPEVTIIDAILGEVSGYDLTMKISEVVEGPAPVIITTAAYDEADEEQALIAGASDVITKPVRDHELLARVRALADSRALYEQVEERAEELEAANQALRKLQQLRDDLTHMIVHDMRTPLTNIISGLQTVEAMEYEGEIAEEFIPEAINAGVDLQDMINNLLDISKMEAGELEPERERFEVCDLVTEAFDRVEHLVREGGLELKAEMQDDLTVNADRALIKRVLVNLLGNAVKFTPEGGSVTVEAQELDGGARVCVTDTGPGISEEEQQRLFRKFSQLDSGRKHQGTGLGLAFVKLAVDAHGGRVWVDSEPGEGSSFCFEIPDGG